MQPQSGDEVVELVAVGAMLGGVKWAGAEITMCADQSIALVCQRTVLPYEALEQLHEAFGHTILAAILPELGNRAPRTPV